MTLHIAGFGALGVRCKILWNKSSNSLFQKIELEAEEKTKIDSKRQKSSENARKAVQNRLNELLNHEIISINR